ncbi:MAG: class I SAM-dependent methyltransferase [Deltaproteobacteria bacterium]|nr:class I SAM-dependent methyltransferase [Deltaproteobacteria bacterium]
MRALTWLESLRSQLDLEHRTLREAMTRAAPYAHGALLDVGCGDKPHEALFRPYVTSYVGAERAQTYRRTASSARSKADLEFDGDRLPLEDESYDTVLCTQVLEHVPDPRHWFGELVRVLRPGGRLIVTTPFSYRVHSAPEDYFRFTRYALQRFATEESLEIEILQERGGLWIVLAHKAASHLLVDVLRTRALAQRLGGYGHEAPTHSTPRWWLAPAVIPLAGGIVAVGRMFHDLDPDPSDPLGHLLVATKPRTPIKGGV